MPARSKGPSFESASYKEADDAGNHTGHTAEPAVPQHDVGIDAVNAATAAIEMERIMAEATAEEAAG